MSKAEERAIDLNKQIGTSNQNSYSNSGESEAHGVVVRTQNDGEPYSDLGIESKVVSAFVHNSINVPGPAAYPYNNCFHTDTATLVTVYSPILDNCENIFGPTSIRDFKKGLSGGVFYPQDSNSEQRAYPVWPDGIEGNKVYFEAHGGTQYTYSKPAKIGEINSLTPTTSDPKALGPLWKDIGNPSIGIKDKSYKTGAGAGIHINWDGKNVTQPFWPLRVDGTNLYDFGYEKKIWSQDSLWFWGMANIDDLHDPNPKMLRDYMTRLGLWVQPNKQGWDPNNNNFKAFFDAMDEICPWVSSIDDLVLFNNSLWEHKELVYGNLVDGFKEAQIIHRWQGWNEVPIPSEFAHPQQPHSGFAFALPPDVKSIDEFIENDPIGDAIWDPRTQKTTNKADRIRIIIEQFDLHYFGYNSIGKRGDPNWIGDDSFVFILTSTNMNVPKPKVYYERHFAAMNSNYKFQSINDSKVTYSVNAGMLKITKQG